MLIARRLRELGVFCEIVEPAAVVLDGCHGLILSGGPASVLETEEPRLSASWLSAGIPILGICYGMQLLAQSLGGEVVVSTGGRGYGPGAAEILESDGLFAGFADRFDCWMSHGDAVVAVPDGFAVLAKGSSTAVMAMADVSRGLYGFQFHPEVTHTEQGSELLRRFAVDICKVSAEWTMPAFVETACVAVADQVGSSPVLLALSGGVDSAVVASLLEVAIPGQLTCVFVDNGLLRLHEVDQVSTAFASLGERLVVVDAREQFFVALAGVTDPEEKRRVIGHTFIEVFQREAARLGDIRWLAQGTIYPDVIESAGSATAASIKSHHNVGGLPADLGLGLVEPLRLLFKDEVRALGAELGLGPEIIGRHPFPGPGMAVRVLGEVTADRVLINQQADAIFLEHLRQAGWYNQVAQAFTVLLPVQSVGVQGDSRTYENVIALRAVTTDDFMTADWARLPAELISACSTEIINEVAGVNRVVYDVSSKPPATVEWE